MAEPYRDAVLADLPEIALSTATARASAAGQRDSHLALPARANSTRTWWIFIVDDGGQLVG